MSITSFEQIHSTDRRRFLGGLGMGFGLVAKSVDAASTLAEEPKKQIPSIDPLNPFAARGPDFAPRTKSVIFFLLWEGHRK